MVREQRRQNTRNAARSSSSASATGTNCLDEARTKEIAAMKARIAELEAILRNRSRS